VELHPQRYVNIYLAIAARLAHEFIDQAVLPSDTDDDDEDDSIAYRYPTPRSPGPVKVTSQPHNCESRGWQLSAADRSIHTLSSMYDLQADDDAAVYKQDTCDTHDAEALATSFDNAVRGRTVGRATSMMSPGAAGG